MPEQWDKEDVYDEEIAPLMKRIISICKEHEIPFAALFQFREDNGESSGHCRTSIPFADRQSNAMRNLNNFIFNGCGCGGVALAETIVTNPDGSKNISIRRV